MQLTKIAGALAFFMAFAIGVAAVFIWASPQEVAPVEAPNAVRAPNPVKMQSLLGTWTGRWDHASVFCTIEITRVDGDNFYGTLTEREAKVAVTGTLDRTTGKVAIHETKVLAVGEFAEWSLGENTGQLSDDLTMTGTGTDKWGQYSWIAKHDR